MGSFASCCERICQLNIRASSNLPADWEAFIHPEGQPYYCLKRSASRMFQYFTEANVEHPDIAENVMRFVDALEYAAAGALEKRADGGSLSFDVDVCLEVEGLVWQYYMVDHKRRNLFWLHEYDLTWVGEKIGGVHSSQHMSTQSALRLC